MVDAQRRWHVRKPALSAGANSSAERFDAARVPIDIRTKWCAGANANLTGSRLVYYATLMQFDRISQRVDLLVTIVGVV